MDYVKEQNGNLYRFLLGNIYNEYFMNGCKDSILCVEYNMSLLLSTLLGIIGGKLISSNINLLASLFVY